MRSRSSASATSMNEIRPSTGRQIVKTILETQHIFTHRVFERCRLKLGWFGPQGLPQGELKNFSRRGNEADLDANSTSAWLPSAATSRATILELALMSAGSRFVLPRFPRAGARAFFPIGELPPGPARGPAPCE